MCLQLHKMVDMLATVMAPKLIQCTAYNCLLSIMCPLYLKQNSDTCDVMRPQRASARVLIAFNLNQKVIRVNRVATTADQDW